MEITITTATSKALRLPEIVHAIVSFLWRYHPSELQPQFCSLILVCKDLHRICTPLLWRNISLKSRSFDSCKAFPFSVPSRYSLVEPKPIWNPRRRLLVVCWFKQGLRKYGTLVRSIDWDGLREGSYHFNLREDEARRMSLKRGRLLSQTTRDANGTTEDIDAGEEVLPGDLPAYNFDDDTDDDNDMEDRLLNDETLPKDDGGVKLRTWILKFCPNLERMTISHECTGMDVYRPFYVEAAKRTMLSSIAIVVEDRDSYCSYSGNTLNDFFESVTGIMGNNNNSVKDKSHGDMYVATTDVVANIAPSKDIIGSRAGLLLEFSMEDRSYYEGGDDRGQGQPWSLVIRMLDTHQNLRSLSLYYLKFTGDFIPSSSYPAMRRLDINLLDGFNEVNTSPFLSLFPNLEVLNFTVRNVYLGTVLTLIRQQCPLLSDIALFLTCIDKAARPKASELVNEFQHSMPHLQKFTVDGIINHRWVRPNGGCK